MDIEIKNPLGERLVLLRHFGDAAVTHYEKQDNQKYFDLVNRVLKNRNIEGDVIFDLKITDFQISVIPTCGTSVVKSRCVNIFCDDNLMQTIEMLANEVALVILKNREEQINSIL